MFVLAPNLYIDHAMNIIGPSTHVLDLDVSMSSNCTFDFHISNLYKRCSNLVGWILRTFTIRDPEVMLTLYKSLIMSILEYLIEKSRELSPNISQECAFFLTVNV